MENAPNQKQPANGTKTSMRESQRKRTSAELEVPAASSSNNAKKTKLATDGHLAPEEPESANEVSEEITNASSPASFPNESDSNTSGAAETSNPAKNKKKRRALLKRGAKRPIRKKPNRKQDAVDDKQEVNDAKSDGQVEKKI